MSTSDNLDVLEYRVAQLEKMLDPLLKLVSDLDKKIALLAQKVVIATVLIGAIANGIGIWYNTNGGKDDKQIESKLNDADKMKFLELEINKLKATASSGNIK